MNMNLLPWRRRQSKGIIFYSLLGLLFCLILIGVREYHARARLEEERTRRHQLEQEMNAQMAAFRKQLQAQKKHHAAKKSHQNQAVTDTERDELQSEVIQVNYAKATELAVLLKDPTSGLLSTQGLLTADPRTNVLWVEDTSEHLLKIKSVLQHLDIPSRQVLIEARLVNMSKASAEDLGVRFGLLQGNGNQIAPENENNTQNRQHLKVDLAALPLEATPASIGLAVATLSESALLDMELSALESEGLAEIIASPKLMTTNQEPAVIESGEDIPYQEVTVSGATSVSFKKAVLSLKVLPQITTKGQLMMALSINQNSDSGRRVQGVPIILTKAIETNVLVNNQQTIVLGGIYKEDRNHNIARIPFLGNLPMVGGLFRRKQKYLRHDELLIFITPKILS